MKVKIYDDNDWKWEDKIDEITSEDFLNLLKEDKTTMIYYSEDDGCFVLVKNHFED